VKIFYEGEEHQFILGPFRAFPGRLSVTRTFGDIEAKFAEFGGNPKTIICGPEIYSFTITENDDFILLACNYASTQATASTTN
jgi:protein phosphatase 2C family protein 2/3